MLAHGFLSGGSVCRAGRAAHPVAVLIQNNRKGCPERGIPFPVFGASRATAALRKNACRAQRTEGAAPAAAAETERRPGQAAAEEQSTGAAAETAERGRGGSTAGFLRAESGAGGLPVPHEFYRICENRHFRRGRPHRLRRRGAGRGVECRLRRGVQTAAGSQVWRISRSLSRGSAAGGQVGKLRRRRVPPHGVHAVEGKNGGRSAPGRTQAAWALRLGTLRGRRPTLRPRDAPGCR